MASPLANCTTKSSVHSAKFLLCDLKKLLQLSLLLLLTLLIVAKLSEEQAVQIHLVLLWYYRGISTLVLLFRNVRLLSMRYCHTMCVLHLSALTSQWPSRKDIQIHKTCLQCMQSETQLAIYRTVHKVRHSLKYAHQTIDTLTWRGIGNCLLASIT